MLSRRVSLSLLGVGLLTPPSEWTVGLLCQLWHSQETGHSGEFQSTGKKLVPPVTSGLLAQESRRYRTPSLAYDPAPLIDTYRTTAS
jgi:hypothetical protein